MKLKYKFIANIFETPPDRFGNVSRSFVLADTRSGRSICGTDVHESNLRAAIFELNGGEHKNNYWFTTTTFDRRRFNHLVRDIPYIGCDSKTIADAFRKAMKTRKKAA